MKDVLKNVIIVCAVIIGHVTALAKSELCQPKGNQCASNSDCCSDFCNKDSEKKSGICKQDRCEPLSSEKLHIICLDPNGQSTPCDKPVPTNSKAIFRCNAVRYIETRQAEYKRINCNNGEWDRPLVDNHCVPDCGKPVDEKDRPKNFEVELGVFPWHAGIYEYTPQLGTYEQICAGTLISHKTVISVAHCFGVLTKQNRKIVTKDLTTLKIGLGKYRRTLNASEDVLAQIVDLESIEIPQEYFGHLTNYADDIAFITLKTPVEYTRAVRPVCVDVGPDNFEDEQLVKGAIGKLVGWGFTEKRVPSEELILKKIPFVPRGECLSEVQDHLFPYVRKDKICGGDKSLSRTACVGDNGGGLVFEDSTKAYFLRGILSIGPKACRGPDFTLYTRLSSHVDMLEKYLQSS